jgi:sugar fermentation stimulation protein A
MRYSNIHAARFLDRPNRFIAHCEKDGEILTVHVKNTGRCRELLVPGVTVWLTHSDNPARKTAWDLIAVEKGSRLINMDANAPNTAFGEFVRQGNFLSGVTAVRPEFTWGGSRFDFRLETEDATHLVEVKGVTLEGCKYPLKKARLYRNRQFAVSNELTGNCALIDVRRGGVWILETTD